MEIITGIVQGLLGIFASAWEIYLLIAPLFLLGLFIAGLLYILISQAAVLRIMGGEGLSSVATAAAFGIPLPICSCAVIPIVATLRKKGASRPACMSFLITTPESGTDSILVTWVLMGPIMAIVRPISSFFTALIAGISTIALLRGPDSPKEIVHHHHGHDHHDHDHFHGEDDPATVGPKGLYQSVRVALVKSWFSLIGWTRLNDWNRPILEPVSTNAVKLPKLPDVVPLRTVGKRMFTFAFVEMADDILLALVIGVLLGGVVLVAVPDDLVEQGLSGWQMYAIMLIAGIPLYMCASASTPIGAAFVAKGVSPGAALVFLLTGPATNTATIVVLMQQFGLRFVSIYLGSIVAGAVVCGVLLDMTLIYLGWELALDLDAQESGFIGVLEWGGAILLAVLIVWRFWKGAATAGFHDLIGNIRSIALSIGGLSGKAHWRQLFSFRSRIMQVGVPIVLFAYIASGLTSVPTGYMGYGKLFGEVRRTALQPGLHYAPPWPIGAIDVLPHTVLHRVVVGLDKSLQIEDEDIGGAALGNSSNGNLMWHSPKDLAASKSDHAEFLTGDENLMRTLITAHFQITDPYVFYYRNSNSMEAIVHAIEATTREFFATQEMDELLSTKRSEIEHFLYTDIVNHLGLVERGHHITMHPNEQETEVMQNIDTGMGVVHAQSPPIGIKLISVNIVDVHPTQETLAAFREVTDAVQEKQTTILEAERAFTLLVPRAVGNAEIEVQRSLALSEGKKLQAEAEKSAFIAKVESVSRAPEVLKDLLWHETVERAYKDRQTFILPANSMPQDLTLWQRTRSQSSTEKNHN